MGEVFGISTELLLKIFTYLAIAGLLLALLVWLPGALEAAAQSGIKTATGG